MSQRYGAARLLAGPYQFCVNKHLLLIEYRKQSSAIIHSSEESRACCIVMIFNL